MYQYESVVPEVLPDIRWKVFIVQPLGRPGGESEDEIRIAANLPSDEASDALGVPLDDDVFLDFPFLTDVALEEAAVDGLGVPLDDDT